MEVNIDNAFFIAVKLSVGPFSAGIDSLQQKIKKLSYRVALNILRRPLLGTLLLTIMLMNTICALTISALTIAAAACIVAVIIIFEGFIVGVVFLLAASITILAMGCVILTQGLKQCRNYK